MNLGEAVWGNMSIMTMRSLDVLDRSSGCHLFVSLDTYLVQQNFTLQFFDINDVFLCSKQILEASLPQDIEYEASSFL